MKRLKPFYITNAFFYCLMFIIAGFLTSFFIPALFQIFRLIFFILCVFFVIDCILLFTKGRVTAERILTDKLSNGDQNAIEIKINNFYPFALNIKIIDEIPFQFQKRDFEIKRAISASSSDRFEYFLRPVKRGEYVFGALNLYVSSPVKLISKRFVFSNEQKVPTYPSFIQLRK